jgi:nucleotide-binding universal stress UspA family protein
MKILIAVDGSPHSVRAVQGVVDHVAWFRERPSITLITVHPPLPTKRAAAWVGKAVVDQYYDEECEAALAPASKLLTDLGIAHDKQKRVGEVAHEICTYAADNGYDLIAMGTHGRTGLQNVVLGSVAVKVLAATRLPVLLIR